LSERSGKIEKAIQDLEKKILEIGGSKLLTQKSKVDGIRLHINIANDEITKAEVAKVKVEKDTLKFNATIQTNQTLLQDIETELEGLNDQITECAQYIQELQAKVDAAQAAAEHQRDDLETLKAELDAKRDEVQKFRKKEVRLKLGVVDNHD
jgi:structural maintenance of chromosome 4